MRRTSATSVCPFSHASVNAVSPVCALACTLAPVGVMVWLGASSNNSKCCHPPFHSNTTTLLRQPLLFIYLHHLLPSTKKPPHHYITTTLTTSATPPNHHTTPLTTVEEVLDKLQVSLLGGLHEGGGAAKLDVRP